MNGFPETESLCELPFFRCHKVVRAGKIKELVACDGLNLGKYAISFDDITRGARIVDSEWFLKHKPAVGGYYVEYPDGYKSYSPAEAFEKGYSIIVKEQYP